MNAIKQIPLVIYTHTSCSFIYSVLIDLVNKHVDKDILIYICYNDTAEKSVIDMFPDKWIKCKYTDDTLWTDRVYEILQKIHHDYILFIHEDWLPINSVRHDVLSEMTGFMESVQCGYLLNCTHITSTSLDLGVPKYSYIWRSPGSDPIKSIYEDYYFFKEPHHVFQPAIWKRDVLEEFCIKLKKAKHQNEDEECLSFMSNKNCYSIQNVKTILTYRTINSIFYPHMHALSKGCWNFPKYAGSPELGVPSLKILLENYGIDTSTRGTHCWDSDPLDGQ